MNELLYLKSGTDIRGTAIDGGEKPMDLTNERIYSIINALCVFLKEKLNKTTLKIAVGYDSRVSSQRIAEAVFGGLSALGAECFDCGMSSTPSMFKALINYPLDATVEITASHLPMEMNGLKFFTREGGFSGGDIEKILAYAGLKPFDAQGLSPNTQSLDNMGKYCEDLREMIKSGVNAENYDKPLEGLKIAVDAGNGVGGFYAYNVLSVLGADISGSCFLEPDGYFPNHIPNPENPAAMAAIRQAVLDSKSDFGVIFDTDCDRAACVDSVGNEINRNKLVALAAYIALKNSEKGIIVTDSVTSDGLQKYIENTLGGVHHRFKRGYKNVIDEAKRLEMQEGKSAPLAIETSGHAAFKENYYLDDGAYLITKIIIELARLRKEGKALESIIETLETPEEEAEVRFTIELSDFKDYGKSVIEDFKGLCENTGFINPCPVNFEGVRVNFGKAEGDGWCLLRMSLHEPLLVLNCESNSKGGVLKMLLFFKEFVSKYEMLNTDKLRKKTEEL